MTKPKRIHTTIYLDESFHREIKLLASLAGFTLSKLIERLLHQWANKPTTEDMETPIEQDSDAMQRLRSLLDRASQL